MLSVNNNHQNDKITFQGMTAQNVKRFIPNISDSLAELISKRLERELPNDVLEIVNKSDNRIITHCMKNPLFKLPIGEIKCPQGIDSVTEKINYLFTVAQKITNGTLYK